MKTLMLCKSGTKMNKKYKLLQKMVVMTIVCPDPKLVIQAVVTEKASPLQNCPCSFCCGCGLSSHNLVSHVGPKTSPTPLQFVPIRTTGNGWDVHCLLNTSGVGHDVLLFGNTGCPGPCCTRAWLLLWVLCREYDNFDQVCKALTGEAGRHPRIFSCVAVHRHSCRSGAAWRRKWCWGVQHVKENTV